MIGSATTVESRCPFQIPGNAQAGAWFKFGRFWVTRSSEGGPRMRAGCSSKNSNWKEAPRRHPQVSRAAAEARPSRAA